jgi:prepilin-type N-terminal cleavage/methylation domain-containing protein
MDPNYPRIKNFCGHAGFTFVEFLMALAIGAGVITVAAISYGTIINSVGRSASYDTVTLSAGVLNAFYGDDEYSVTATDTGAYFAPSYGRAAKAEILRDSLYEDVSQASAVFCLSRTAQTDSSTRLTSIPINPTYDARRLDTPNAFLTHLEAAVPATAGTFSSYRGTAPAQNLSIYILEPSQDTTELAVIATYEVDFVEATSPAGTYASVRRYQGTICTDFYDVFYPVSAGTVDFLPVAASFERAARLATVEGNDDLMKVAGNLPFFMVWWPDPAAESLKEVTAETFGSGPRSAYGAMTGRTSLFMVLPMFPAL